MLVCLVLVFGTSRCASSNTTGSALRPRSANAAATEHAEFLHVKPGKGSAFVRTKLKNQISGNTVEKTFRAGEKARALILGEFITSFPALKGISLCA